MGSSNDGLEKIQRLNEHNRMPKRLIGGRMNVLITISHISKPKWSSKSFRDGIGIVSFDRNEVTLVISVVVEVKLDMALNLKISFFDNLYFFK